MYKLYILKRGGLFSLFQYRVKFAGQYANRSTAEQLARIMQSHNPKLAYIIRSH